MPKIKKWILWVVTTIIVGLFFIFVYKFRQKLVKIILPFILAMVIAYLLHPIVKKLEKRNISRTKSIIMIYICFSIVFTALMIFIVPQIVENTKELMNTLPQITLEYKSNFNGMVNIINSSKWPPDIKNAIFKQINTGTTIAENAIIDTLKNSLAGFIRTISTMFDFVLAMIIAFYLIKDAEFFKKVSLSMVPRKWRNGLIGTFREINEIMSNFIQGQLLTALIVGTLETIALLILGVKYPLILGMVGGIANIIPYFGPIIGAIPSVAIALIESPIKAMWTIIAFIVIQQLDNGFISPKIIEGRLGLHPVTTILAVLVGSEFFGIVGMLVAVPVAAVLKVIFKRTVEAIV